MNRAMLMSKFISTKTTTQVKLNCGLITLEFAVLIKPQMTVGQCFALVLILKLRAAKFRGFLVNHGNLRDNGNCLMDFSKKLVKNVTGGLETRQKKNTSVFKI